MSVRAAITCFVLLVTLGSALAAESSRKGDSFGFSVTLERRHDDNILELTPHDLARLENNPSPPRFLVTTPDDDINIGRLSGRWTGHWIRRRATRLAGSAAIYRYSTNSVKNWEQFRLEAEQEVTASRERLGTISVWFEYTPDYYLRQITDQDASFAAGRRLRRSLDYAEQQFGVRYTQELIDGRLTASVALERVTRDYNDNFNERDGDNDQLRLMVGGKPFAGVKLHLAANYRRGELSATGDLASSPIRDTDISYKHHGFGGSASYGWGKDRTRGRVEVSLMPQQREYQTADRFDLNRFGRVNHRRESQLRLVQRVGGPFELLASAYRLTSDATFNSGVDFADDTTDFKRTVYGLALRARFGFGAADEGEGP